MKPTTIFFASSLLLLSISPIAHAEETKSLADTLASEAKETQMRDQKSAEEQNLESAGEAESEDEPSITANTLSNGEIDNLAEQVTTGLEKLLAGKKEDAVKKEDVEKIVEEAKEQGNTSGDIQKAVIEALDELKEKGVDVKKETLSFVQESMGDILNEGSADSMGDPASIYIQSLNAELAGAGVKKSDEKVDEQAVKPQVEGESSKEKVDGDKVASAIAMNLASNKATTGAAKPDVNEAESKTEASERITGEKRADVDGEKVTSSSSIAKTVDGQISMATQKGPKGTITVVHGESLSNIARRIYGNERYYQVIFDANRDVLKTPNLVRVGQILKIPPKPE
ncbi:MAG TPA: LysM peptidoglycan-binding domain-containing protein [Thiothrix sp.]|nr:LysM peptidoglycan-binding domain-containing protein [Thiothrix sp.]